jgi:chromosomal replication initiator protein
MERPLEPPPVRARGFSTSVDAAVDNRDDELADRAGAEGLWSRVSLAVQSQLAESTWNTWFRGVRAFDLRADDDVLVLAVPNVLAIERIRTSYAGILNDAAQSLTGSPMRCDFVVATDPRHLEPVDLPPAVVPAPAAPTPAVHTAHDDGEPRARGSLNPRYTFDDFIVGASNRFAQAASLSVAESPARTYNPLFIYGPAGLGKTHLLHAIGHHVLYLFTTKHVRYVSTETMMNEFVDAMRLKSMPALSAATARSTCCSSTTSSSSSAPSSSRKSSSTRSTTCTAAAARS